MQRVTIFEPYVDMRQHALRPLRRQYTNAIS